MAVLIYADAFKDPRMRALSVGASVTWMTLVHVAGDHQRDTLTLDEADTARARFDDYTPTRFAAHLDELQQHDLIRIAPLDGAIRMLARLDLWAYETDERDC